MRESPSIANKRAVLITGCSSGIGKVSAFGLQALGFRVFASARKPADVDDLKASGLECVLLDLQDSDSIKSAVEHISELNQGKLYALFNNGAYGQPGAVEDLSRNVMREQFETNVFGTMELTNLVLPLMRRQGHGRLIQNSSILGFVSMPFRGAYNASKYALEGFSDTLRQELKLAKSNIKLVLIEPGPIRSKFRENAYQKFLENIDQTNSPYQAHYKIVEKRLSNKNGKEAPFTLKEEAVLKVLLKALNSRNPKARYYVTFPTHLFGFLKRILTDAYLDKLLIKGGYE